MGFTSSRYGCTIGTKNKSVKFFFKFFFRWVWARGVWARGCGCGGVGRRDRDGGGIGMGLVGSLDGTANRLPGLPHPEIGLLARV